MFTVNPFFVFKYLSVSFISIYEIFYIFVICNMFKKMTLIRLKEFVVKILSIYKMPNIFGKLFPASNNFFQVFKTTGFRVYF